jgi:hypothetical protein
MKVIRPTTITDAMLLSCSIPEPDTGEVVWGSTTIYATGDTIYLGTLTATVTFSVASPGVVNWANHGLVADQPVVFTNAGGALPAAITSGTTYYVKTVLTSGTFTITATVGGRAITFAGAGTGTHTGSSPVHTVYECVFVASKSTVTMTSANPGVVTWNGHGLANLTQIVFTTTGALPTNIVAGTTYYTLNVTANTFQVSSDGVTALSTVAGVQSGVHTCGLAATYNKPPLQNSSVWTEFSSTNRWNVFDQKIDTASTADGNMLYILKPGSFDSFALLKLSADTVEMDLYVNDVTTATFDNTTDFVTYASHNFTAGTAVIIFNDAGGTMPAGLVARTVYYVINPTTNTFQLAATVGGAAVNFTTNGSGTLTVAQSLYSNLLNTITSSNVGDWKSYFYEPIYQADIVSLPTFVDSSIFSLPGYSSAKLRVNIIRVGGQVSCGVMVLGLMLDLGTTKYAPEITIIDYSTKTKDSFGNWVIVQRAFSKKLKAEAYIDIANIDSVAAILSTYRATPLLWFGTDDFDSTIIYGFYVDWATQILNIAQAVITLNIEGLSQT